MGIPINPSGNLTATGRIAIKNVGHAQKQQVAERHGVHVSVLNRWRTELASRSSGAKKGSSPGPARAGAGQQDADVASAEPPIRRDDGGDRH
jgi:transposase-like protein